MAQYELTRAADRDIEHIFEYGIETFGIDLALRYQNALKARFAELADNPQLYPASGLRKGYRRSVCGVHSIYYRMLDDGIQIVRVLGRQDASRHLP